jgi:HEAT repeat protein
MKRIVTIIVVATAAVAAAIALLVSSDLGWVVEQQFPELFPPSVWARHLHSKDPAVVRESLYYLAQHKNPAGVDRAIPLLDHPDPYVWLNAALYLGVCGRAEATPYLIKALRHSAVLADKDTVACLQDNTGENFGSNFIRWQQWWLAQNPGSKNFNWESHLGSAPRLPAKQQHSP